jgi:CheY-like chemotaxis protein
MRLDKLLPGSTGPGERSKRLTGRPRPLAGVRLLIAEDETLQALALADIIDQFGGAVTAMANHFDDAMEAAQDGEFDCAILDVNLGGMLSFPIADRLQERGVPILFCTAYADAAKVFARKGPVAWLDKPVDKVALRDALLGLLTQVP